DDGRRAVRGERRAVDLAERGLVAEARDRRGRAEGRGGGWAGGRQHGGNGAEEREAPHGRPTASRSTGAAPSSARRAASRAPSPAATMEPFMRMCTLRATAWGSAAPASVATSRTIARILAR